jgi:broad specificity phosphatase PhoE
LDWELEQGTQVLLIRHGETESNRDGRIQGHLDVALSARGVEQARMLASALAGEEIEAIYSSDLCRARATADLLARGERDVIPDPRLREANMGLFQGLTAVELRAAYPEAYEAWRQDSVRNRPLEGETLEDLGARCMAALRDILPRHAGKTVAVVAHGGPVRVMACGLLNLPLELYGRLRVENTSVSRVLYHHRGFILSGWNDISHLRSAAMLPDHSGWEER